MTQIRIILVSLSHVTSIVNQLSLLSKVNLKEPSLLCEPLLRQSVPMMEKLDPVTVGKRALQSQELSLLIVPACFHDFVCSHCLNMQREGLCIPQAPQSASNCSLATKQQKNNWIYILLAIIYPKNKCPPVPLFSPVFCGFHRQKASDIHHIFHIVDTEY